MLRQPGFIGAEQIQQSGFLHHFSRWQAAKIPACIHKIIKARRHPNWHNAAIAKILSIGRRGQPYRPINHHALLLGLLPAGVCLLLRISHGGIEGINRFSG